jgi:predicted transcriptional regulator
MKSKDKKKRVLSICLDEDVLLLADELAQKDSRSRSSFIQFLIISAHTDSLKTK